MEEVVRYTYRLRPGAQAERDLMDEWHRCRWLWNEAVHQERTGKRPTAPRLCRLLTVARSGNAWLRAGSAVAQKNTLRDYAVGLNHSFTVPGRGRPQVKKRTHSRPSLNYSRNGFRIRDGRLCLAKGVSIPVVWSRELPAVPSSVRVYRDTLGHWYASFVVRRHVEPAAAADKAVGIDWGVTTTATASDPAYDLPYLGHRRRCASELAKAQRKMARRRRSRGHAPSNGYRQARLQAARLHKRAQRRNSHDVRVWAKRVVADHHTIAVEDLRLRFLRNTSLARKSADGAVGVARQELIERAERAGRRVVIVAPAYTTMTCSRCFARATQQLGLAERNFRCQSCGYTDSRDRNAARTILAVAERGHTSVDDVRHGVTFPSGLVTHVLSELGIPHV